jgi:hypothetical protein
MSFTPTNNFDFCSFSEILCLISFQAFDKYIKEDGNKTGYIEHIERLRIFLKYIDETL